MGPDELISRGIEGVTKRLERLAGAAGAATRTRPDHPAGSQSSGRGGRFFPGATSPLTVSLLSSLLDRKSTRLNSSHDQISYAVANPDLHSFPTRRSSDLMGPDELISRGIEGVTKRLERLAGAAGAATRTRPDHPAGSQSSGRGGRFFPGATSPLTVSLLSSL